MTPKAVRKYVSYIRVSTKRQGQSGLGLEAQRSAVEEYVRSVGGTIVQEFQEVESGRNNERPRLAQALAFCRLHHGAVLVIAKLDRLARNVAFISNLMESGCEFTACDLPQANKLTVHLLAAMAEHEAEMISARTKAALSAAKRRGAVLGGVRDNSHSIWRKGNKASAEVRAEAAERRADDLQPIIAAIRADGAQSLREIAAGLNERGIPTARGGEWSAVQVMRVLAQ